MKTWIISDDPALGERVRLLLTREGQECPSSNIVPLRTAVQALANEQLDLIAAVVEPNVERALAVVMSLKGQGPGYVLAIGQAHDPKQVLRVLRSGIDDYVDSASLEVDLKEALQRWRAKMSQARATGKIISVIAPNGGCGTSTLCANLSVTLARRRERVLLVDLHLHTNDLAALLDLKPVHTIADLCQNISGLDRALFTKVLTPHESGVELLAPPRRMSDAGLVTPAGVCQALMLGRANFPFVVVDIDVGAEKTMQEVIIQSDLILLVFRPDVIALRNARRIYDYFEWMDVSPQSIRAVLARVGQVGEVPAGKVEAAMRTKLFHIIPEDLKVVNSCNNMGVPVMAESPRSRYAANIEELVTKIAEALKTAPIPLHDRGPAGKVGGGIERRGAAPAVEERSAQTAAD